MRPGSGSERFGVGSVREQKKIPGRSQGCLTYAATGWGSGAGVVSGWAAGRGLVTPAMNLSASLVALSRERQGYRQLRNRKVSEALVQGVETARAVLTTTPQGQAADAQFVKWLMEHQKEAGVFATVSGLVDQLSDNPAARLTAQEIAERVRKAQA